MKNKTDANQFQFLFEQDHYIELKTYLYSYILRKIAVNDILKLEKIDMALEVGSGLSPVMKHFPRMVYSDLSFLALKQLKEKIGPGMYVVSDGAHLPFKSDAFSHIISSEVLEHIPDDVQAINQIASVMRPSGKLIITFPHRNAYYTFDDRFVSHFRRYELFQMKQKLKQSGFLPAHIQKVLGPMDKVTICLLIFLFMIFQKVHKKSVMGKNESKLPTGMVGLFKVVNYFYAALAWLDARFMPMSMSSVLLVSSTFLNYDKIKK